MNSYTRIIPEGSEAVSRDEGERVIAAAREFLRDSGLTHRELARGDGFDAGALTLFLAGEYPDHWEAVAIHLDDFLERRAVKAKRGEVLGFTDTKIAREVMAVARLVRDRRGIGVIRGDSGIGKTTALRIVANETPRCAFVSVSIANLGIKGFLEEIGRQMGRLTSERSKAETYRRVVEALWGCNLLIVDEVHKLCRNDDCLEVLRDLFDETGVPQIWSGTTDLIRYLNKRISQGRQPLAQIRRRIIIARDLSQMQGESFSGQDIRKILGAGPDRLDSSGLKYMVTLANLPEEGALGLVKNLYSVASAGTNRRTAAALSRDVLQQAHAYLGSQGTREMVRARLVEAPAPEREERRATA